MENSKNLRANEKLELILETFNPYVNDNISLTLSTLKKSNKETIDKMYALVNEKPEKTSNNIQRPICPVKSMKHASMARAPYKKEMKEYISQWGINFNSYTTVPFNVFEALANYLESKTN